MKNRPLKLATGAFLIIVVSVTEMPGYLKYSMLAVAGISLIVSGYTFYRERIAASATKHLHKTKH